MSSNSIHATGSCVGLATNDFLSTGYVYASYVPIIITPLVGFAPPTKWQSSYDMFLGKDLWKNNWGEWSSRSLNKQHKQTNAFAPRKGIMSRYGKKKVNTSFYGKVNVLDLNGVLPSSGSTIC